MRELITAVAKRSMRLAQSMAEPLAEGSMNSVVKITRGTEPVFNETTRELEIAAAQVVYEGIGGVWSTSGPVEMSLGDEPQYYSATSISIPRSAANPRVDDIVEVISVSTDDAFDDDIVGRLFRVTDVEVGGRIPAVTKMSTIGVAPSRQWGL